MNEKILEKLEDPNFIFKLMNLEDENEVTELFSQEGVNISEKEKSDLAQMINKILGQLRKMPEDELKKIAGGNGPSLDTSSLPGPSPGINATPPAHMPPVEHSTAPASAPASQSAESSYWRQTAFQVGTKLAAAGVVAGVAAYFGKSNLPPPPAKDYSTAKYAAGAIAISAVSIGLIYGAYKKWYSKK